MRGGNLKIALHLLSSSSEPELTDVHFRFHPQQTENNSLSLVTLWWFTSSPAHWTQAWCHCLRFDTPQCQLCQILMNLAIISGEVCPDPASCDHYAQTPPQHNMEHDNHPGPCNHKRSHLKSVIIVRQLTNNDHYWISEVSVRKKVPRFKIH